jgi:hypothetical protein
MGSSASFAEKASAAERVGASFPEKATAVRRFFCLCAVSHFFIDYQWRGGKFCFAQLPTASQNLRTCLPAGRLLLIPNAFGTGPLLIGCNLSALVLFFSTAKRKEPKPACRQAGKAPPFALSLRGAKGQLYAVSQFAVQLHGAAIFPIVYQMMALFTRSTNVLLLGARQPHLRKYEGAIRG